MKKALPPGIGFTAETKHTLLADKQSTNPTEILAKAHARCQSSYSGRTSPALTPASRTGNENVTDCAMSFPNRINGPAETLSKVLYNRVDVPSETVLVNHWVYRPQNVFEKKSKSQNTCSYSDSEKMSRIPNIFSDSSQTGITNPVSSNESSMPSSNGNKAVRKGGSLSFDDLEDDTIYAIDCKTKVLQTVPDSIPNDLEELSWKRVVDGVVSLRYVLTYM